MSISLRDAREADIPALAELHVRTFQETHGDGPSAALREKQWRAKFASGQLVFCVVLQDESGDLVGFASGELHRSGELADFSGELNKIYVVREYQRRGLGRRILCAAAERFLAHGVTSMLLFGDARSLSNGFYERMGAERLHSTDGGFHGGYGWRDLEVLALHCAGQPLSARA